MKFDATHLILSVSLALLIGFFIGGIVMSKSNRLEVKALQAQVDKKYCEGEVTLPQLKKELLGD